MMVFIMIVLRDSVNLVTKASIARNSSLKMSVVSVVMGFSTIMVFARPTKPLIIVKYMIVLVKIGANSAILRISYSLTPISVFK